MIWYIALVVTQSAVITERDRKRGRGESDGYVDMLSEADCVL